MRIHALGLGLSDVEIDSIMSGTAVVLPADARAWFRWHNSGQMPDDRLDRFGASKWVFEPLDFLVGRWRELVEQASVDSDELGISVEEAGRGPMWFPIFGNFTGQTLAVDCSPGLAMPALHISLNPPSSVLTIAPSLTEAASWCLNRLVRRWCVRLRGSLLRVA